MRCSSQQALADALGVNKGTLSRYLDREDWPVGRRPPWGPKDIEAVLAWQKTLQEDRAKASAVASQAATLLKVESAKMKQLQRKALEGLVIDRRLVDKALEALARLYVGALDELERSLPLQIAGLDPGQVEKVVKDRVRSIREQLASRQVIELEAIEQAVKAQAQPKARGRPGTRR